MQNEFMRMAIAESNKTNKDIPVGAVIIYKNEIISKACNQKEETNTVTDHAEIIALHKASDILNNWRLEECEMYVTLEPCPMCGWAILQSRIKNLYFGSYDLKYGAFSCLNLENFSDFNTRIYGGILEKECNEILQSFWERTRKN